MSEQAELQRLRASCRVCLCERGVLNIFSSQALHKLLVCTDMQIRENDGLPNSLCIKCDINLNQAFNFRMQCFESDRKLQQLCIPVAPIQSSIKSEEHDNELSCEMPPVEVELIEVKTEVDYNSDGEFSSQFSDSVTFPYGHHNNIETNQVYKKFQPAEANNIADSDVSDATAPIYHCHYCEQVLTDRKKFKDHIQEHKAETYKCDVCNKEIKGANNIKRHKSSHVKVESHPCQFCGVMINKYELKLHIEEKHLLNRKKCPICGLLLCLKSLPNHMQRHKDLKIPCEICSKLFRTKIGLRDHLKTHSKMRPYPCSYCGKRFNFRKERRQHERLHTGLKPYSCPICDKAFTQYTGVKCHLKNTHQEYNSLDNEKLKEFINTVCQNVPTKTEKKTSTARQSHDSSKSDISHAAEIDSSHRECTNKDTVDPGKDLSLQSLANEHPNAPQLEKTPTQKVTDSSDSIHLDNGDHKESSPTVHEETRNTVLSLKSSLRVSQDEQTELRSSLIPKKSFQLVQIIRPSDIDFTCVICTKTLKSKAILDQHLKTHSNVRDYQCSFCEKRFTTLHIQVVHERIHTGEKPFKCPLCDKCFTQQSGVKSHFRHRHKEYDYTEERKRQKELLKMLIH